MPTTSANVQATWLGFPQKKEPAMTLELDKYELENMQKLMSMLCKCGELFPLHTGDWTYQVMNKLRFNPNLDSLNFPNTVPNEMYVPMPTVVGGFGTHVLPDQKLDKISVRVGEVLNDGERTTYQVIIFYHYYSNEAHEQSILSSHEIHVICERVPVHTKTSETSIDVSWREIPRNLELPTGTYEYADYLITKALKEKDEK